MSGAGMVGVMEVDFYPGTDCGYMQPANSITTQRPINAVGGIDIGGNVIMPPGLTGYHGTSGTKVQLSDGTGTSGNLAIFAADGSVTNGPLPPVAPTITAGTPTVGQAACIKAAGPPVLIGYCSTVVDAFGACTCN
jgi:hypothetical protein